MAVIPYRSIMEIHSTSAPPSPCKSIPEKSNSMGLCNKTKSSNTKRYPKKKGRRNRRREQIWLRLQQALDESSIQEVKRCPTLKISRTVELINQTNEGWREDKSKLLFMVGIGLTPIPYSNAVPLPLIILSKLDEEQATQDKEDCSEVEECNRKKKLREERIQRFEKLRAWRANYFDLRTETIEVIDLTSDNETMEKIPRSESSSLTPPSVPSTEWSISNNIKSYDYRHRPPLKQVNHKRRNSTGYTRKRRRAIKLTIIKKSHKYGNDYFQSYIKEYRKEFSDALSK